MFRVTLRGTLPSMGTEAVDCVQLSAFSVACGNYKNQEAITLCDFTDLSDIENVKTNYYISFVSTDTELFHFHF